MTEKKNAVERLEELLHTKDREIERLEEQVHELKNAADFEERYRVWFWTKHSKSEEKEGLPVPRLEIRWRKEDGDGYNWVAAYNLVYRHYLGDVMAVPLGATKVGGQRSPTFDYVTMTESSKVETPFRDGVHIMHDMRELRLPGFAVYDGKVTELKALEGLAPWQK